VSSRVWVRVGIGVVVVLLLWVGAAGAAPMRQPAGLLEIAGAPLRIQVGNNGSVQVYHQRFSHGATYGSADSGFFIAIGSTVYGPDMPGTNSSSAANATSRLSLVSHEGPSGSGSQADPFRVTTTQNLVDSAATLGVVQTISYINGNNYFQLDWRVTNNGGGQSCFKAYHAADIYFADSDLGIGYYNAASGAIGGFNQARDWFMVFAPLTPATRYKEAGYRIIWNDVGAAVDLDNSVDPNYIDNGIALQWNVCLNPGESTVISDLWSFGDSEAAVIPTVIAPPGGSTPPPGGATPPPPSGPVDVWVKDSPEDDGSVPSSRLNAAWWTSPDVIVRNAQDNLRQHQNPVGGQTNYVYVQVRNRGSSEAQNVRVSVYWANPALGLFWPNSWNLLGSTTVNIPAGATVWTAAVPWTPSRTGHLCLLVRLESAQDPIRAEGDVPGDNNIGQRNVHVMGLPQPVSGSSGSSGSTASGSVDAVVVAPPGSTRQNVDVAIQYANRPASVTIDIIMPPELFQRWQTAGGTVDGGQINNQTIRATGATETIIRTIPLEPGEEATIRLDITGPTETPFVVGAVERVNGQDVGGNVYVYEGLLPETSSPFQLPQLGTNSWIAISAALCLCLLGVIGLLFFFLVFSRRDRSPQVVVVK
jgi:hypothetical protein